MLVFSTQAISEMFWPKTCTQSHSPAEVPMRLWGRECPEVYSVGVAKLQRYGHSLFILP